MLVYRFGRREEAARVEFFVAQKVIRDAVVIVGSRFRRECHDSTARLAVFRLEPVGVHGELGDGLERRRVIGDLGCIRRSIGRHRNAVERRFPRARLAAAEGKLGSAAARLGRDRYQVEGAPQRPAHHQRQLVDHLVLHRRRDLRVLGLDLRSVGADFDSLVHLADLEPSVDTDSAGSGKRHVVEHRLFEASPGDLEAVSPGRKLGPVVFARAGRGDCDALVGGDVRDRDCSCRNRRARRICHRASDVSALGLSPYGGQRECQYDGELLH